MPERRRKFYGWGYEGDTVSREETVEFETAWSKLLGIDKFEPVPFPTEDDIELRAAHSAARFAQVDLHDRQQIRSAVSHLRRGHGRRRAGAAQGVPQPARRRRLSEDRC